MAKKPTDKPETRDGEGTGVDGSGAIAATSPTTTDPGPAAVIKQPFTSQTRVSLTELNASAQRAHREKRDVEKLASEAAARAIASVIARTG